MSEKLCLQWNDFKDNIISSFGILRKENDFADVTLVSEDGHKLDSELQYGKFETRYQGRSDIFWSSIYAHE